MMKKQHNLLMLNIATKLFPRGAFDVNTNAEWKSNWYINLPTLSKAIGRESLSIGADDDDDEEVDAVLDGCDMDEATDALEENCGLSVYKTSWLFADGRETAVAVIFDDDTFDPSPPNDASTNDDDKLSRSLLSGTLDAGSIAQYALNFQITMIFPSWIYFGTDFIICGSRKCRWRNSFL